jgi:hypothetical protein
MKTTEIRMRNQTIVVRGEPEFVASYLAKLERIGSGQLLVGLVDPPPNSLSTFSVSPRDVIGIGPGPSVDEPQL